MCKYRVKFIKTTLAIAICCSLVACGGGSGSSTSNTTGVTGTPITSTGIITGFGSVFVNGVRFHTNNSRIVSDDDGSVILQNPSNAQLQNVLGLGQVITVNGSQSDNSNGIANTIRVDNELLGQISSVSSTNATFVVLGQTVSVTPNTIIDDSIVEAVRGTEIPADLPFGSLSETLTQLLQIGMTVEISGLPSQNGFEATRIEDVNNQASGAGSTPNTPSSSEVKGVISNLTPSQFEINGLTVIYEDSDLDSEDFASQTLSNGQFVEVHGSAISPIMIDATRIELESQFSDDNFLNNQDNIRINDLALSNDGVSFTTRLGLRISPTSRSRLEDKSSDNDNISIGDFLGNVSGNRVEARGFSLNGSPVWTRLEIDNDSDLSCRLRGPVSDINGNANNFSFSIEGVVIDTSQVQDNNFEGTNNLSIGRVEFFNALSNGDIIQATSDDSGNGCINGQLTAREVEFEPVNGVTNINNVSNSTNVTNTNNSSNSSNPVSTFNDTEITGTISSVSANSFVVGGQTINVTADTLIDDSIIETARGVEISNDLPFGSVTESLQQLLPVGLNVEVQLSNSNDLVALSIEDD